MKSKRRLSVLFTVIFLLAMAVGIRVYPGAFRNPLPLELIDNQFPDQVDVEDAAQGPSWVTLPFGYTFGPWPTRFKDNPIVMKMTYQKGPPQKFIQQMIQVWDPIHAELSLEGPKTPVAGFTQTQWSECFKSAFRCLIEKRKFNSLLLQDLERWNAPTQTLTWFESADPLAPKGVHIHLHLEKFQIDRYVVLSENGIAQSFTLKSLKGEIGAEAQTLFVKILGAMKVKEDLANGRAWIQNKIQHVNLNQVQNILEPKLRYAKLIQIQNELFSELSVEPTSIAPFFHLAGVTHLLAIQLLKGPQKVYPQQDSWISHIEPLIKALQKYVADFPKSENESKNIESLLQDILLLEQKISNGQK